MLGTEMRTGGGVVERVLHDVDSVLHLLQAPLKQKRLLLAAALVISELANLVTRAAQPLRILNCNYAADLDDSRARKINAYLKSNR